jgi:Sodium/hydrogen exchanger family
MLEKLFLLVFLFSFFLGTSESKKHCFLAQNEKECLSFGCCSLFFSPFFNKPGQSKNSLSFFSSRSIITDANQENPKVDWECVENSFLNEKNDGNLKKEEICLHALQKSLFLKACNCFGEHAEQEIREFVPKKPQIEEPGERSLRNLSQDEGKRHADEVLVVVFLIFSLLSGAIFREINKRTGVPYTPMCLLLGIIAGSARNYFGATVSSALTLILNINPHGILMIFIPTLLFESGFNINWYVLKKNIYQVLLLAFPGVAVGALILGLSFNYILGYASELSIFGALTAMSIICATDSKAVKSLKVYRKVSGLCLDSKHRFAESSK